MVFCPNCGANNKEGARFCYKCGHNLTFSKENVPAVKNGKSPIVAAILNFLLWGIGYYYLGLEKVHGYPWYHYTIVAILSTILYIFGFFNFFSYFSMILSIIISIYFAIDAYNEGKGMQ